MVSFHCPLPPVPLGTVFSVSSRFIREWILSKGNITFVFVSVAIAQSWQWVKWLHTIFKIQRRQEWRNVSKVHTIQARGPEFDPQKPLKSRHGGAHLSTQCWGEEVRWLPGTCLVLLLMSCMSLRTSLTSFQHFSIPQGCYCLPVCHWMRNGSYPHAC